MNTRYKMFWILLLSVGLLITMAAPVKAGISIRIGGYGYRSHHHRHHHHGHRHIHVRPHHHHHYHYRSLLSGSYYRFPYYRRGFSIGIGIGSPYYYSYSSPYYYPLSYSYPSSYYYRSYRPIVRSYVDRPVIIRRSEPANNPNIENLPVPPRPSSARIEVIVPKPSAQVYFEGQQTSQTGAKRLFESPTLQPGHDYTYRVKVVWKDGGQDKTLERDVKVQAGRLVSVDFTR